MPCVVLCVMSGLSWTLSIPCERLIMAYKILHWHMHRLLIPSSRDFVGLSCYLPKQEN